MRYKVISIMTLTLILCLIPIRAQDKLLLAGSCNTSIMIVDKTSGSIEWQHTIEPYEKGIECNSVDITEDENILYSYKKGAKLININHKTIWNYQAPVGCEIHSACVLPDGGYLLAINGVPTRIIELDKNGKVKDSINIKEDLGNNNIHMQCRQIRKARNGNYLVTTLGKNKLYEVDSNGNTVRTYNTEGGAFSVLETEDECLIIPLGDSHSIQLICRKTGDVKSIINRNELQGCTLQFAGEICELKNGHFIMANWSGHGTDENSPQVIEFDLCGNVYWTLKGEEYGNISTCRPLYKNILK